MIEIEVVRKRKPARTILTGSVPYGKATLSDLQELFRKMSAEGAPPGADLRVLNIPGPTDLLQVTVSWQDVA